MMRVLNGGAWKMERPSCRGTLILIDNFTELEALPGSSVGLVLIGVGTLMVLEAAITEKTVGQSRTWRTYQHCFGLEEPHWDKAQGDTCYVIVSGPEPDPDKFAWKVTLDDGESRVLQSLGDTVGALWEAYLRHDWRHAGNRIVGVEFLGKIDNRRVMP